MLELIELNQSISDKVYKRELPEVRTRLLELQQALRTSGRAIVVIIGGLDNATKGEMANTLNQWLDTRGLEFHAFGPKSDEELERPRFWRYWRSLPARGRIGIFAGSWYTGSLIEHALSKAPLAEFDLHMQRITRFERMLVKDGVVILKFWLHRSKSEQKRLLKKSLVRNSAHWRFSALDRKLQKKYRELTRGVERTIQQTDSADTPWFMVEAVDSNYRNLTVGRTLIQAFERALQETRAVDSDPLPSSRLPDVADRRLALSNVDLSKHISNKEYDAKKQRLADELAELSWHAYHRGLSTVIVFEGWDAAGKGGAIQRLLMGIDARISQVIQIAAPTDEEKAHHYLWRFWRHLPRAGHVTIYDRSWYGRVLVERVEEFAKPDEWRRAYSEINEFESQLTDHGILLVKFWLHISPDEQLKRFKEREALTYKNYKITDEDWRNRDKWDAYEEAVHEMVVHTSTESAPWHLIPANDKHYARIAVMETVCAALRESLQPLRKL